LGEFFAENGRKGKVAKQRCKGKKHFTGITPHPGKETKGADGVTGGGAGIIR